jgi:hypothetical protein
MLRIGGQDWPPRWRNSHERLSGQWGRELSNSNGPIRLWQLLHCRGGLILMSSELRHFCRHCRGRLATPTANHREAFDSKGCHRAFYRHRCIVCEGSLERKSEKQKLCRKSNCRNAFKRGENLGRYHSSQAVNYPIRNPIEPGIKSALRIDRGMDWAIAVNSSRIRAPRYVLDAIFGDVKWHVPDGLS